MIRIINLQKSFGCLDVLRGIDLTIGKGGISAILGPNGSGKTTLIKSILGMVIPDKGKLLFNGKEVQGQSTYRSEIAHLPQIARFPENLRVSEVVEMIKDIRQQPAVYEEEILEAFELKPVLSQKLRNLSGGTRQKVNILLSLMFDCPLLILDEPTVGLDPLALIQLKRMIRERRDNGKKILLTTHILGLVEDLADEIIFLLDGTIRFQGTLEDMIRESEQEDLEHAIARMQEKKGGREIWIRNEGNRLKKINGL